MRLALAAAFVLAAGCAFAGDPPGGPPDVTPPKVVRVVPESGAVLTEMPHQAEIDFDKVIAEQIAGQQRDISGAVILSPVTGKVSVGWHRTRITVEPKGGFRAGRIYRLELLPGVTDLRQNRMKRGRLVVFSTGPPIPDATLKGTIVDWPGNKAATGGLVEAVLLPDSLPYRALTDSAGDFAMRAMPAGEYLVYGVIDQNGNRRREPREAYDTARVTLQDSASLELYAFTHDTVGPRLRTVEAADSLTLKLSFDRPLDPSVAPDTSQVHLAPADDSTAFVPLAAVMTSAGFDSLVKAAAAAAAAADSAKRAAADTTHRQPAGAAPAAPAPAAPAAAPSGAAPGRLRGAAAAPMTSRPTRADTTRAMRMLIRRPSPTDTRIVRLTAALTPGARYVVFTAGLKGLTGIEGHGRGALLVPKPAPRRAGADSLRTAAHADSLHRAPADTLRPPPDTAPPAPRPPE
ncbi:MAG TPA: Ig-like domain-containing protein [Gemmatimonadales bacterium]|nr:Ig-like domain-containing protein [Gemmatimonadales bacterium]